MADVRTRLTDFSERVQQLLYAQQQAEEDSFLPAWVQPGRDPEADRRAAFNRATARLTDEFAAEYAALAHYYAQAHARRSNPPGALATFRGVTAESLTAAAFQEVRFFWALADDADRPQMQCGDNPTREETRLAFPALRAELALAIEAAMQSAATAGKPADSAAIPQAAAGRAVDRDDHQSRQLVAERWERFKAEYRELGYRRASHENFAAWVEETFDDMPSADADELRRMVEAYKKTPEPKRLS